MTENKNIETGPGPALQIINILSKKWTVSIFRVFMTKNPVRYTDILSSLPGLSTKVLSQRLTELECDGFITRTSYPEMPPRVEYSLTEAGIGIAGCIASLQKWGEVLENVDTSKCASCKACERYQN